MRTTVGSKPVSIKVIVVKMVIIFCFSVLEAKSDRWCYFDIFLFACLLPFIAQFALVLNQISEEGSQSPFRLMRDRMMMITIIITLAVIIINNISLFHDHHQYHLQIIFFYVPQALLLSACAYQIFSSGKRRDIAHMYVSTTKQPYKANYVKNNRVHSSIKLQFHDVHAQTILFYFFEFNVKVKSSQCHTNRHISNHHHHHHQGWIQKARRQSL